MSSFWDIFARQRLFEVRQAKQSLNGRIEGARERMARLEEAMGHGKMEEDEKDALSVEILLISAEMQFLRSSSSTLRSVARLS
mmetsp:Transcript_47783/g.104036  ORF Transcript_47783/g.104036 Transcript_47783/m.104036 type:complete len:83 (-) Transcript_47783:92-340(-)